MSEEKNEVKAESALEQPAEPQPKAEPQSAAPESPDKAASKRQSRWCCGIPVFVMLAAIGIFVYYQVKPQDNIKRTPARGYTLPSPSQEALNRNISCNDFRQFSLDSEHKYKPLCKNLYATTEDEINQANSGGQYNLILLYGEHAHFQISLPHTIKGVDNLGESFLRTAKFTDLITLPKEMEWYGIQSFDYIPKELAPYPALSYTFGDQEEIKTFCHAYVAGCAILNFEVAIKDVFLAPPQNVGMLATTDAGDKLEYEIDTPQDCYADTTTIHETGHALLIANKVKVSGMQSSGWLEVPSYMNEQLTEISHTMLTDQICGAGTVKYNSMVVGGKTTPANIVDFTALYPPPMLHPTSYPKDNECEKAIMSSYSRYLKLGQYQPQFTKFVTDLRNDLKTRQFNAFNDDKLMAKFMLREVNNDPAVKDFLNSHACGI